MARALRIEQAGATYHVTSRGNRRQRIFESDHDRERFLELLAEVSRRYGFVISAYVLMTNHFHLVLKTSQANLSQGMKWLNGTYAAWYNRRHSKVGHLFGERYKGIHVQTEEYMRRLARYVILNPVRANMAATPQEYRWSSYRATAGLEAAPEWLATSELVPYFGDASSWQETYASFVAEGILNVDPIWKGLRRRIFLGTEEWLRKMRQKVTIKWSQKDIPHDQRAATRTSMGAIVGAVAKTLGTTRRDIRLGHGGIARMVAAWLGIYEGRRRLRVIAQTLRLQSCSRVTQLVAECERRMRRDASLREQVHRLRLLVV
jgi:REP element-mobilizing transposase RayT